MFEYHGPESVRAHYRRLVAQGFEIRQGHDAVGEDDFLAAYLLGQSVDLYSRGRVYFGVRIGGWADAEVIGGHHEQV